MAHVHSATLAERWRNADPFPGHDEEISEKGFQHVLDEGGWQAAVIDDGKYINFWCPDCCTHMFQANTDRGIHHAYNVAKAHKPTGCCKEREERFIKTAEITAWPDRTEE